MFRKHNGQFVKSAIKRGTKEAVQKFASYIKKNGINVDYLQNEDGQEEQVDPQLAFCSYERIE